MNNNHGFSGRIAQAFQSSQITPLLALIGLLLGVLAILVTPREEEPQINVTFANIFIAFPGASAKEVEELITTPAEQVLSELTGVEHIYSVSQMGRSVLTVQFKVGEDRTQAIVRLYNAIYSNRDWLPENLGVSQPIIKPKGIDDVPIITLTLSSRDAQGSGYELSKVAHTLETELKRVKGTRDIYTLGGPEHIVNVELNVSSLDAYNISIDDLKNALRVSNSSRSAGNIVKNNRIIEVQAGQFLSSAEELKDLVVAVHNGKPVYLRDVARVQRGPAQAEYFVRYAKINSSSDAVKEYPAVTLAIAKQAGTSATRISERIIRRIQQLKGVYIPSDVEVAVTRNYGKTANDKAQQLITKLAFATVSVVLLVLIALGWREATIVGSAVIVTLALTLFASLVWGFTLNRVSLFALIFSIGILVDDAIVVVENISRHFNRAKGKLVEIIPKAVEEVGGPTVLATLTVIAALLPMAFVTGLMGPYMSPIPINASIGMLISLIVAFVFTPWLARVLLRRNSKHELQETQASSSSKIANKFLTPFIQDSKTSRVNRWLLFIVITFLIVASMGLVATKVVVLKMLPFDNKSEFQIVVDMPEGTSVEKTAQLLTELGQYLKNVPEVSDYQIYAGIASPINFNGLVRQYYLRKASHLGDIQVNLIDKAKRQRKSHAIAKSIRAALMAMAKPYQAVVKIVEPPSGPPVFAPLVAEVYGPNYDSQIRSAKQLKTIFEQTNDISDIDDSVEAAAKKIIINIDQQQAALYGVSQQTLVLTLKTALAGVDVTYLHSGNVKYALPVRLQFDKSDKDDVAKLLNLKVRSQSGHLIPIAQMVNVKYSTREQAIYHKDLLRVVYVTGDMSGDIDSPLYGMFAIYNKLAANNLADTKPITQYLTMQPDDPNQLAIKWDGEWQVTYETFRDMGIAYSLGLLLIYLLVVAQFRSYLVPLIIMAPIPLTIIGVMPGHALLDAKFTATSMIGMIALAGIIVRNSILLVDFINQQLDQGEQLQKAVIDSVAIRAKPITLTGLAAMLGAFFILDDPIFNGLAISLIFGILLSTLLTLVVIPVLYYLYKKNRHNSHLKSET